MSENTREIALGILLALEREEDFSHILIKAVLDKYNYLEERDKSFIKRLTEGTIERQIELDHYLDCFSTVPTRRMKPLIRCLMRMSVYQLLYMDNVPDSAVCNEACKLAQKKKFGNLKGFVNGVLRRIAREKDNLPLPDAEGSRREYLSVKYSMPLWLVDLLLGAYGGERAEVILQGMLAVQPVSLRFRTDMSEAERKRLVQELEKAGVSLRQSGSLPYVYYAENTADPAGLPGFAEGKIAVQNVSSAMAVEAAQITAGDLVLDICAAPGGKSLLAAEKTGADGKVFARDLTEAKISLIEENKLRMGADNVITEVHDATEPDVCWFGKADVLLADVPCSGLGVIGRKRDIKYRVTEESLEELVSLQRRIIEASWRYVKPGGTLLYSTCTINPEENEKQTAWLQEQFPFRLEEQRTLLPGIDEGDGFYYARLRRTDRGVETADMSKADDMDETVDMGKTDNMGTD